MLRIDEEIFQIVVFLLYKLYNTLMFVQTDRKILKI